MANFTTEILGTECIGNSLPIINQNFSQLDTAVSSLSSNQITTIVAGPGIALQATTNTVTISATSGSTSASVSPVVNYGSGSTTLNLETLSAYSVILLNNTHSTTITFANINVGSVIPVGRVFTIINASTAARSFGFSTNIADRVTTLAQKQACTLVVTETGATPKAAVW